jgi:hypothetical protein
MRDDGKGRGHIASSFKATKRYTVIWMSDTDSVVDRWVIRSFRKIRSFRSTFGCVNSFQLEIVYFVKVALSEHYDLHRTGELTFHASLRLFNASKHRYIYCDNCSGRLAQDRVICLECDSSADIFEPIDLCSDVQCLESTISTSKRSDLREPHLPSHDMLKTRDTVVLRDLGLVFEKASTAIAKGKLLLRPADISERAEESPNASTLKLRCSVCTEEPSLPCWFCTDCPGTSIHLEICPAICYNTIIDADPTFLCQRCDIPGGIEQDKHKKRHFLVLIQKPKEPHQKTIEDRLEGLENELYDVKEQLRIVTALLSEQNDARTNEQRRNKI